MDLEEGLPLTGVMYAATVSSRTTERFEQFVSVKHAGLCLLLNCLISSQICLFASFFCLVFCSTPDDHVYLLLCLFFNVCQDFDPCVGSLVGVCTVAFCVIE